MNRLIIIGAGGHGKVVADIAAKIGYTDICFADDHAKGQCLGFPILGGTACLEAWNDGATDFVIGIGNNAVRKKIAEEYDINWVRLVHPSAQIGLQASIGRGTVVMAGAVINACAGVGEHCIINTRAVVEHDDRIGNYVHLSPGVTLSGTVTVGECTWLGTGTSVINNVDICANVTVGVGSVVIRSIQKEGIYYGLVGKR
jgi:sugar O-acyltransferase (sialic acid O-acetyltransferase NeuD family)